MISNLRSSRCNRENSITCGMLPILHRLSTGLEKLKDEYQAIFCLMPLHTEMDTASRLQITLLEAYCREVDIVAVRKPAKAIQQNFYPNCKELPCVLVALGNSPYLNLPD